jgi:hypothetical protein
MSYEYKHMSYKQKPGSYTYKPYYESLNLSEYDHFLNTSEVTAEVPAEVAVEVTAEVAPRDSVTEVSP